MAVNKVVINTENGAETLIDLTEDNVTAETLAEGATAHDASGTRIMGTMKAGGDPVQSDWNQTDSTAPDYIKNKPFGEVPDSDTLTWNGNTDGLYSFEENGVYYYKVNDAIITLADLEGGFVTYSDSMGTITLEIVVGTSTGGGMKTIAYETNGIVRFYVWDNQSGYTFYGVYCYPEGKEHPAGVYFVKSIKDGFPVTINSLTTNGCRKFLVTKTIDPKYLPDDSSGCNSVSWASAGLDFYSLPEYTFVKVSNAMVTMNDLASITENDRFFTWVTDDGDFATYMTDESTSNPLALISKTSSGIPCILITDANGNTYDGVQFRVDGVYFWTGRDAYPVSVTVPGFGKFESSTTIDSKYLPEGLQTETITLSDTVMIDSIYDENGQLDTSKFAGKEMLSAYTKVSDASIYAKSFDFDDYSNGYYLGECMDEWGIYHIYTAEEIKDGFYRVLDTDENGNIVYGGFCAAEGSGYDPGLYLNADCSKSFTFFYGAIFETRTPKPIDKKYLPDDIGMPEVTAEDNGKFLRVVDGVWSAVAVPNAEGGGF